MKLELRGHTERYAVEQSLLNLFPGELPVYEPITETDDTWAIVSLSEEAANSETAADSGTAAESVCHVSVELSWRGQKGTSEMYAALSGSAYEREGRRRHWIGRCFFLAAREAAGVSPPWGMLSGVRPDKIATRALLQGHPEQEARRILEQDYFVCPERAALAVETGRAAFQAAQSLQARDIAVYVGIPFCPTRCAYCSFVSQSVEKRFDLVAPYVDALIAEIRAGGELVRRLGLRVRCFYMGGGTPTTLTAEQLDRVLCAFTESFAINPQSGGGAEHPAFPLEMAAENHAFPLEMAAENHAFPLETPPEHSAFPLEMTVEAGRPDTITAEKLDVLRRRGVNRISVNPQSMEERVLQAIGRRHTAADVEKAMELAAAFSHVNMDVIAGLPEDTPEGFQRTLERCLAFRPDNLTVHTLALKKGSRVLTEKLSIPDGRAVETMLNFAASALRRAGYAPYYLYRQKYMSGSFENTGWSLPGAECLYNICEMSELCSVLSFGAGGASKLIDPARNQIVRLFNPKYPAEYLEGTEKRRANREAIRGFYE